LTLSRTAGEGGPIAQRSEGEGLLFLQRPQDCFDNAFGVRQHVVVPKPDDAPTLLVEDLCSVNVCFAIGMLTAISFNDEVMPGAGEIDDEITDRMLPAKPVTGQTPVAQNRPEPPLG